MKNIIMPLALLFSFPTLAQNLNLQSGKFQTQVIELFTSEGCSSCPPADKHFIGLKKNRGLWLDFVPIAMHVDYWDYIGWKDEFALQGNVIRQQMHKITGNINSVYTPGMLKAGKEWRAWRFADIIKSPVEVGELTVTLKNNKLNANFNGALGSYNLNIGLLGMNISSMVNDGENKGRFLRHDFVLLKQQMQLSKTSMWEIDLNPDFFKSKHKSLAFVVWLERETNPAPIQAVGTFL